MKKMYLIILFVLSAHSFAQVKVGAGGSGPGGYVSPSTLIDLKITEIFNQNRLTCPTFDARISSTYGIYKYLVGEKLKVPLVEAAKEGTADKFCPPVKSLKACLVTQKLKDQFKAFIASKDIMTNLYEVYGLNMFEAQEMIDFLKKTADEENEPKH